MKKLILFVTGICFSFALQAQVAKTATVTAGNLRTVLTSTERNTVTSLRLTGTIDARDFVTMRDNMPVLAVLDLSGVTIAAYTGPEGTSSNSFYYNADAISDYAFFNDITHQGKTSLISVVLPSSTITIGSYAFTGCVLSGTFTIPLSVTTIGSYAFESSKLTSITIPPSVTSIGINAFLFCTGLINVDADNQNYSSIDGVLFDKDQTTLIQSPTSKTGSYTIPSTVTSISRYGFGFCSGLTLITIPSSVISIGEWAFDECSGLTSIIIPSSVTSIGWGAFWDCRRLNSITISSSIISIEQYAFGYCSGLISMSVGCSVPLNLVSFPNVFAEVNKSSCILHVPYKTASRYAIADQWKDFTNIVEESNGFNLSSAKVNIEAAEGSTTTVDVIANVNWIASSDQTWLTVSPTSDIGNKSILLTANVNTSIGTRTAKVTVSAIGSESQTITVTQAGSDIHLNISAGNLKTALTSGELASTARLTLTGTIDARDFKTMRDEMPLLAELDLSGVSIATYTGTEGTAGTGIIEYPADAIPDYTFYNNITGKRKTSLTSVVLPSELFTIGRYAFYGCSGLTSTTIPSVVTTIGDYAFNNCKSLFFVDANNLNFSSIDGVLFDKTQSALIQCPISITGSYSIPSSVKSIGNGAFEYCSKLTSINIPSSVTEIGNYALYGCSGLTLVSVPMSVTFIGNGTFRLCNGLITVDSKNPNYSSLDGVLFNKTQSTLIQCPISNTGSYTIPSSVTDINDFAFENCNKLTSITIPSSVTSIGRNAFRPCSGLISIYAYSPSPIFLDPSMPRFDDYTTLTCKLYIPFGSSGIYRYVPQWKNFRIILEMPLLKLSITTANLADIQGSATTAELTSNTTWTASSDQTWITVSPASGTGNQTLTFSAEANLLATTRTATVTVSAPAQLSGVAFQILAVTQDATTSNISPVANAGADQSVTEGVLVTLDGSSSSDPNSNSLTYLWTAPAGITLNSTTDAKPTFIAPDVSVNTDFLFSLVVNDGTIDSQADQVTITIKNNSLAHFIPVWTGNGFDHMNINIYSAKIDGVELEAGDEVGIFDGTICVGVGILTEAMTQTNTLDIVVSRNDGSGNGYTSGDAITYKLYDKSQDLENANTSAVYANDDPSWSTDGKFVIGLTSFAAINGVTKVYQDISLNTGWNIISANVVPSNLNLKDIFQTLIDVGKLKKVMDETGKTIENFGAFGGWKNNIGNLNSTKGYKVNVTAASTLSLEGIPVALPLDINLAAGWNIIAYPSASTQDAKLLVQSLIDSGKLKKVMDETGKTIENFGAFGGWKNNIGNFVPGKGYKVNVTENCILTIPADGTKSAIIVPELLASEHFKPVFIGNGTDHMSINLVNLQASGLAAEDEIGIFDGQLCVGSAMIGAEQLMAGSISIPASANDELQETLNGFTSGHPVELQLYRGGKIYRLSSTKLDGNELFEKNGSLFTQANTNDLTGIQITDNSALFKCYPNPFTSEISIEVQNSSQTETTIEIYNMAGQRIKNLFKGNNSGNLVLKWNGTNDSDQQVAPGVYLCKVNGQSKQVIFEGENVKK